ncbi:MAG: S9 family peptidase [Proteobacteria bacterium]|nr:S9 family peptidase [Pseudomonadota bacterium]
MHILQKIGVGLAVFTWLAISLFAAKKEATFDSESLKYKTISDVLISPGGELTLIAFLTPYFDKEDPHKSTWRTSFLITSNKRSSQKDISMEGPADFYNLQWAPNGKWISYISPGDKFLSLWIISLETLKSQKLLELDHDIHAHKWAPNGAKIAIAQRFVDKNNTTPNQIILTESTKSYSHLYVVDVTDKLTIGNNPTQLTSEFLYLTSANIKSDDLFSWSPDSLTIAFLSQSAADLENQTSQISTVDIKTGKITSLVNEKGGYLYPLYSPDGKWLAYVTNVFPEKKKVQNNSLEVGPLRVCLTNVEDHQKRCLAKTYNEQPHLLNWTADSSFVVVSESYRTLNQVYKLPVNGKDPIAIFKKQDQLIKSGSFDSKNDFLVYTVESFTEPPEVFIKSLDDEASKQISHLQEAPILDKFQSEVIKWKSKDGKEIEGILILPEKRQRGKKYPVIVLAHDGPNDVWSQQYVGELLDIPINLLELLNKGYAILAPNYRGSTGYGLEFRQANFKDLGGKDLEDLMSGVRHIIKEEIADSNKIAIWGWGYGGYLATWAIIQTQLFKTAVVGAGINDWISFVGQTSDPELWEAYMGGYYWDDYDFWFSRSPSLHLANAKTPTLIQAGDGDYKFPYYQAMQLNYSLTDFKIPNHLILYPNQEHSFSNPQVLLEARTDLLKWLDAHMVPSSSPVILEENKK